MTDKSPRDTRLDLARALAMSLVLIWHLQPLKITFTENNRFITQLLKFGVDQVYYQVTLLAVPLFFLVSSYLFFSRMGDQVIEYSKKRFVRILGLYVFWTAVQFIFFYGIRTVEYINSGNANLSLPLSIPELIMHGGPGLPYVGGSIYYFLFVLLVVILLSTGWGLVKDNRLTGISSLILILISLAYFEVAGKIPYWRADNFLIYVPIAYLLWKDQKDQKAVYLPILFIGYALFSLHDLYLRQAGYHFEGYSRISIVLGATALFAAILQIKNLPGNKTIDFLSRYSLGIFATHKFWQLLVILVFVNLGVLDAGSAPIRVLDLWQLAISGIVVGITILFIGWVRKTPLVRFIS